MAERDGSTNTALVAIIVLVIIVIIALLYYFSGWGDRNARAGKANFAIENQQDLPEPTEKTTP